MTTDAQAPEAGIHAVIQQYFDALYHCDPDLLLDVFHPAASLFDADGGRIFVDPISSYHDTIRRRTAPASRQAPREDEVVSVDQLSPAAAVAKVRLRIHDKRFADYLMLAFDGAEWRIVAKLWHLEDILTR